MDLGLTHTRASSDERLSPFLPLLSNHSLLSSNYPHSHSANSGGCTALRLAPAQSGSLNIHAYPNKEPISFKHDEGEEYEMVQTYGIVSDSTTDPIRAGNSEESQETNALLGKPAMADSGGKEGHATVFSCISNLLNTIIGSGEFVVSRITPQASTEVPFI